MLDQITEQSYYKLSFQCDKSGRDDDDDALHTLFEYPAFQLYQEDMITTLQEIGEQPLTPDNLVPMIMLKSADRQDQVVAFVALTMHSKIEIVREQQRRPIAAAIQHPMSNLAIPSVCYQQPSNRRRKQFRLVYFHRPYSNQTVHPGLPSDNEKNP